MDRGMLSDISANSIVAIFIVNVGQRYIDLAVSGVWNVTT
jgi:hypothetical protein